MKMVRYKGKGKDKLMIVNIGRRGVLDGLFGNPIVAGQACIVCAEKHSNSSEILICFRKYFVKRIEEDMRFREMVMWLWGRQCYCPGCKGLKPLCHGEVIRSWLYVNNEGVKYE